MFRLHQSPSPQIRGGGRKMANILIVDDQPCVRELLSEELILEGYRVHAAGDAESIREHLFGHPL